MFFGDLFGFMILHSLFGPFVSSFLRSGFCCQSWFCSLSICVCFHLCYLVICEPVALLFSLQCHYLIICTCAWLSGPVSGCLHLCLGVCTCVWFSAPVSGCLHLSPISSCCSVYFSLCFPVLWVGLLHHVSRCVFQVSTCDSILFVGWSFHFAFFICWDFLSS